jgi:hypothetical protein
LAIQGCKTTHCKNLEKKALKYIRNLYEITSPNWEEYLKTKKKKRPKVAPAEHQTTVNPTNDLPTFSLSPNESYCFTIQKAVTEIITAVLL